MYGNQQQNISRVGSFDTNDVLETFGSIIGAHDDVSPTELFSKSILHNLH